MSSDAPAQHPPTRIPARVVPFDARRHAGWGFGAGRDQQWCAQLNAVPLLVSEFFRAALHYPIAFVPLDGSYRPVAVVGLRDAENLFVDDGHWNAQSYQPAAVRYHPFRLARRPDSVQRLICVDEAQLSSQPAVTLLDANGHATEAWKAVLALLEACDADDQRTERFCTTLAELNLLVAFDAVAAPATGPRMQLRGLYRIDEQRLAQLAPERVHALLASGELRAIHAQLLSLENFGRLLERMQKRDADHAR